MPYVNKEDRAYSRRLWRSKNPDKVQQYSKEQHLRDRQKSREYSRNYHAANRAECVAKTYARQRTLKGRYNRAKSTAGYRGINFDLTLEEYATFLVEGACRYCGGALPEVGCGLDRKNSDLSYSVLNCVPCCTICNRIRGNDAISHSEMFEVIKLLQRLRVENPHTPTINFGRFAGKNTTERNTRLIQRRARKEIVPAPPARRPGRPSGNRVPTAPLQISPMASTQECQL